MISPYLPELKSPATGLKDDVRPKRAHAVSGTDVSKKALGRAKAKPKRALSGPGEANTGIARVQAGSVRIETRLEKAHYVAKESTSRF